MKKELSLYAAFIGFLSLIIVLTLTPFAQAQSIQTWTGSVSFTLKVTNTETNTSGNRVFETSSETFEGTMNFYWDTTAQNPTAGPDGCLFELLSSDGVTKICFPGIAGIASENEKSGEGSVLFVAIGTIATTVQGGLG